MLKRTTVSFLLQGVLLIACLCRSEGALPLGEFAPPVDEQDRNAASTGPVDSELQGESLSTADEDVISESEEKAIIEMRLRAMRAELASDDAHELSDLDFSISVSELDAMSVLPGQLGILPTEPEYPADNLPTEARISLGRMLFFDKRLSRDKSMSCATCHNPGLGYGDGQRRAQGFGGVELNRHSPTVINVAFNTLQFWDGRAESLEEQALGPLLAAGEMNMPSASAVLDVIQNASEYEDLFEAAYPGGLTWENVGRAIAAFERTIVTGPSRFDQYLAGEKSALSAAEKRGLILFFSKASCVACHQGANFTDNKFHAIGIRQDGPAEEDLGRFLVSNNEIERNCFKTPGLRNIEQSPPYMHDGSLATLEDVVEFYNRGGEEGKLKSNLIKPLNLTVEEKQDLVAFLRSLTGPLPRVSAPAGTPFGI